MSDVQEFLYAKAVNTYIAYKDLKAVYDATCAELNTAQMMLKTKTDRVSELETENAQLKERLGE